MTFKVYFSIKFDVISNGLEFWSVNHTSLYENYELNVFENIKFSGETSNNWPNDLFGQMHTKLVNLADNHC